MQISTPTKYKSFSFRLTVVILIVTTFLFLLSLFSIGRYARQNVKAESIQRAESTLNNTILRINSVLQSVEIATHNLAWVISNNLDNPEYMYTITTQMLQSNSFVSGSAVAFEPSYYKEKGFYYSPYSYRDADNNIVTKQLGDEDYNYFYMDWYQIPKLLNKPYWSEPYYDTGGGEMIMTTYSHPIYDKDNNLIAVFTADLSLEWFEKQVNSIKPYPNSYNYMIGRGGTFLVHPNTSLILNETIFSEAYFEGDTIMSNMGHKMIEGQSGMERSTIDRKQVYTFYAPIEATGWSVGVVCQTSDIFAGLEDMNRLNVGIAVVGLLLLVLLCFTTIRRMMRPLEQFAHSANEIATGNFHVTLPRIKSNNEMKMLYNSFEYMQRSLNDYIQKLQVSTANKERIESELRIARSIQLGMVPKVFPPFPDRNDIDLYARLIPAKEVGGDLYDFFIENNKLHFIIGDVSGKGVPASLVMAVTCRLFRTIAVNTKTSEDIVRILNNALSDSNESNMFCTAFVGILDLTTGRLDYCNAGHNPPVIIGPNGDAKFLDVVSNLAMGIWGTYEYQGQECFLADSSILFLYTDGINESENHDKELFSNERMVQSILRNYKADTQTIVEGLLNDVKDHAKDTPQSDDITVLCCRYNSPLHNEGKALFKVKLKNEISELEQMNAFVDEIGETLNLPTEEVFQIRLAMEEAVANVILYAYPKGESNVVELEAQLDADTLTIQIIDYGMEFDPTEAKEADTTLSSEERPIGGLGIFLIRQIMDSVEYQRIDGRNILLITKKLNVNKSNI